jgi:prepilin-type N-terminal cleavage/methylation domain-containing protein
MSEGIPHNRGRWRAGFTLLEVLIVTAVIGILAAIVLITMGDGADSARREVAKRFEKSLESGLAMYVAQVGHVPNSFYGWVAFGDSGSQMNFVRVERSLRLALANPDADVSTKSDSTQLKLVFPNNMVATYDFNPATGKITTTITP